MSGVHDDLHADVERDCEQRDVFIDLPDGQKLHLELPQDMESLRIQELVAQRLGFETSQIRLVDSLQPPPDADASLCLQVEVRARVRNEIMDWALEMNSWPPHRLKQELMVFVQENLDMRPLATTPDKTWPVLSFMCLSSYSEGPRLLATNLLCPHMDSLEKEGTYIHKIPATNK